jgi:hypothetical protein
MRTSLLMRAVLASATVTLFISLGVERPLARTQSAFRSPVTRPGIVHGHGQVGVQRDEGRNFLAFWGRNDRNRFNRDRFSRNNWFWNQGGFYDSGFWYSPYAFADPASGAGGGAPLVVIGAPALTVYPAAAAESFDQRPQTGCVIHKLMYDEAGKYVGERQFTQC